MLLKKGFLVAFEGIDGAGKTTQARLLYDYLLKKEFDVLLTKEPTDSIYGRKIKKLAQRDRFSVAPNEEYQLFVNDRKVHVENLIKPALKAKKIVIMDRYYFSNIAYQGALGLDPQKIKEENESFAPVPEIVFLLRVPPRVGIRRIEKSRKQKPNLFEKEEELARVGAIFATLKEDYLVHINGAQPIEIIHKTVVNVINDIVEHYLSQEDQYSLFNRTRAV